MPGGRPKGYPKTGGRKPGSPAKLKLVITDQRMERGEVLPMPRTPLEVLLDNMQWAVDKVAECRDPEEMARWRQMSNTFAEKAAPYVHAKLQATAPLPKDEVKTINHAPYIGQFDGILDVFTKARDSHG